MWYNYSMDMNQSHETIQDRSLLPLTNYTDSWNVRARFLLNEFAREPKDIEKLAYEGSCTQPDQSILDVGAADGAFLERTAYEFLHTGNRLALDINPKQFLHLNYPDFTDEQIEAEVRGINMIKAILKNASIEGVFDELHEEFPEQTVMFDWQSGDVTELQLPDASFDRVFALFMLYHVPADKRDMALQEMKRVMKDDGVLVLSTSGAENKSQHRIFEQYIATKLGIEAPVRMNDGFTTEKALQIMPKHFKHVYRLVQETEMVIQTEFEIAAYMASQLSMYNQYTPIPDEQEFQEILEEIEADIRKTIAEKGEFVDRISRSIYIGTDDDQFVPGDPQFEKIA
jgi:ubiquinone/menaquinone biosynthesis C-methylase UbiE